MKFSELLFLLFSYFLGCINTGYYYTRYFYKQDIRKVGTNVTGAANVSRLAGKKGFVITFLGDALKGALVVMIGRQLQFGNLVLLFSILFVVLGHIFPLQLKFRGGKGISTLFGALLTFHPILILYLAITSVVLLLLVHRYTIASLFALLLLPLELFIADYPAQIIWFMFIYAMVINFACRSNLIDYVEHRAYQGKGS